MVDVANDTQFAREFYSLCNGQIKPVVYVYKKITSITVCVFVLASNIELVCY